MTLPEREEEIILRGHIFKNAILELYDHRCSVSGFKVELSDNGRNISMIDACHIVPFAESGDGTITNGFALAPTLHRAFDRGLIGVSDDYRVVINPKAKDYSPGGGIRRFEGQKIVLPADPRFYPSKERFRKHLMRFGL
jgi:putative restriction endonuclease